jgi:hypothetical protein
MHGNGLRRGFVVDTDFKREPRRVVCRASNMTGSRELSNFRRGPLCRGGTFEKSRLNPSAIVGCAKAGVSVSVEYESRANIAVCTAAMTSPASAPIIIKPRIRSSFWPIRAFMKPCLRSVACAPSTEFIGNLATRTMIPWRSASPSLSPTWASGGSVNMQYETSRPRVLRFLPARLSRMMRKSSSDMCVNCGLPAHSPIAQTSGALVSNRPFTRT